MIYNFNRGIGWASSGVEYAQAYRGKVLRKNGYGCRFIYTDMFRIDNIALMTENIGIPDEEVIWLYQYFTDFHITRPQIRVCEFERDYLPVPERVKDPAGAYTVREADGRREYHGKDDRQIVYAYYAHGDKTIIQKADFFRNGRLLRADYYSYGRTFSEYFANKEDGKPALYLRHFYNEDGSIAYEEYADGDRHVFRMKDGRILYSKQELLCEMVRTMPFQKEDVLIVDRTTEIGQPILRNAGAGSLLCVIHAEHYNEADTTQQEILWNNYYEYAFAQTGRFSAYVASTKAQKELLRRQFIQYRGFAPLIAAIPVGNLDRLRHPDGFRKRYALCTASRLASEKHLDYLILAAWLAHEELPDLTLDIYGKGGQEDELRRLISDIHGESFIRLMGQQDMTEIYQEYSAYVSASTSEGFGLSLMEAVGSGLPMIGFDVPYGNQTFIADGENGYLIPWESDMDREEGAQRLAEAILTLFEQENLSPFIQKSYEIAEEFLEDNTALKWKGLFETLAAGSGEKAVTEKKTQGQ